MKRLIAVLLALIVPLAVFAGCGKGKTEETTTVPPETTAVENTTAAQVEKVAIATLDEDGKLVSAVAEGAAPVVLTDALGNSVTINSDTKLEAVNDSLDNVTGIKVGSVIIPVALNGNSLTTDVVGGFASFTVAETTTSATTEGNQTTVNSKETTTKSGEKITTTNKNGKTDPAEGESSTTIDSVAQALDLMENNALFSYRYDSNADYFYTDNADAWQRAYGFNEFYDWAAPLTVMFYDTVRAKFTYGDEDWMIQMWKGQYGWVFIGGEIGVYYKPSSRTDNHYDCADEDHMLKMEMSLYRDGTKLFTRDYAPYWWVTGFMSGYLDKFSDRSELAIQARVTCKDSSMAALFGDALAANGFHAGSGVKVSDPDSYRVLGSDVVFVWQYIK